MGNYLSGQLPKRRVYSEDIFAYPSESWFPCKLPLLLLNLDFKFFSIVALSNSTQSSQLLFPRNPQLIFVPFQHGGLSRCTWRLNVF